METGKYICRQTTIGDDTTNSIHTSQIPLTGIFTIHQFQNTRASTLYRQMDMLTYIRDLCNDFQRFVTHIFRVRSSETDTYPWRSLGYSTEQHRESNNLPIRFLKTVGIYVLSQQSNFLIAFNHEVGHFVKDAFHITTTLPPTGIGNDTIRTEVITSAHDGYKSGNVVSTNTRRDHISVSFGSRKLHIDSFLACLYSCNQIRKSEISIRPYHQVDVMIRYQIILYPLGHTSQYSHNQISFFLFK